MALTVDPSCLSPAHLGDGIVSDTVGFALSEMVFFIKNLAYMLEVGWSSDRERLGSREALATVGAVRQLIFFYEGPYCLA